MRRIYGEQPFWFWNGEMREEEIERQIRVMHGGGARGFFLHPRQGMDVPYMSERFLDLVEFAVGCAGRLGMEVWLYDEYPYPSGVAGGELLLEPSYQAKTLRPVIADVSGGVSLDLPWGKVLYAKAAPVNGDTVDLEKAIDLTGHIGIVYNREIFQINTGLTPYNRKRFFTGEHLKRLVWTAPEGSWRVMVYLECEIDDFKYFGGLADPLNKEAMSAYIRLTHEKYRQRLGHEFGKTIKGIFTDETSPIGGEMPWSPLFPKLFSDRNGYDMIPHLPKLSMETGGDDYRFLYDYQMTALEAFEAAFDEPIKLWCEQNGLLYTGEKPHLRLSQMRHMHIPGCDAGHVKAGANPPLYPARYRANPRAVASAAHFYGDGSTLCEAYHSLGWSMTLRDMRWMADWLGVLGVDLFVPHAFFYSVDALRKHDAPASAYEAMPWWKRNTLYTRHIERAGWLSLNGRRVVRTLIADPTQSRWAQRPRGRGRGAQEAVSLAQKALAESHIEHYLADTDILMNASIQDGGIVINGEVFGALVIPGIEYMEVKLAEFVERALDGGVLVFSAVSEPKIIFETGEAAIKSAGVRPNYAFFTDCGEMAADIAAKIGRDMSIMTDGHENAGILATQFEADGSAWIYAVNMTKDEVSCEVSVKCGDCAVAKVDTVSGEAYAQNAANEGGYLRFVAAFAPFEGVIYRTGASFAARPLPETVIDINEGAAYPAETLSQNIFRIGHFDAKIGVNENVVTPMPVINQIELMEGGLIPLETTSQFGCVKRLRFPAISCRFEARFRCESPMALRLVAERNAIRGENKVYFNGEDITGGMTRFNGYAQLMEQRSINARQGENTLVIELESRTDYDGIVDPLYIYGDFAAFLKDGVWTLSQPVKAAALNDPEAAGLPFYGGEIRYDVTELIKPNAGKFAAIRIPGWMHEDCVELIINGESKGAVAWNPFEWRVSIPVDCKSAQLIQYTSMLGAFEGARFEHGTHTSRVFDPADSTQHAEGEAEIR